MTPNDVRKLALALPEAEEQAHFDKPSFRVRGKIFATLWEKEKRAVLKLSLEEQDANSPGGPAELLKASQRALEDWQRKIDERVKHAVENLAGNLPALGRDMQVLTQRLEELEKKLDEIEKNKQQ